MRLSTLLATFALISTLCSACARGGHCITRSLSEIAISYAAAGENGKALKVAQSINRLSLKADTLSQLAVYSAKAGQAQQAAMLFEQALQVAQKIESPPDKAMALEAIALKYKQVGQKDKAAQVLSQALHNTTTIWGASFVRDTVLEKIAANYAELGDYDKSIQVANKIVEDITKSRALSQITAQYLATGQYNKAREIANKIEVQATKANALTEIAAKTGEYQQALTAAQMIDEDESVQQKVNILNKIALLYSANGEKQRAIDILSQALQSANKIEDVDDKIMQLSKVVVLYTKVDKNSKENEVISEIFDVVQQFDNIEQQADYLARVAFRYGSQGQKALANLVFDRALFIAKNIKDEKSKARILGILGLASAYIKPYDQVIQFIQTLGDARTQISMLIQIARNYAQVGNNEQAVKGLEKAFQLAQALDNPEDKANLLSAIAIELSRMKQYERAIAIAQTISITQKNSPKAATLAKIASSYAKDGQKQNAITVATQALEAAKVTQCSD
jgi:tetratricopeptide (TPR) repeat protein